MTAIDPRQREITTEADLFRGYGLDDAGWRCPVCGAMAGLQDLDDDPDLPCWDCQQDARDAWSEYVREGPMT